VKLADGNERNIQHMAAMSFWHPDGTPMSAQQVIESLLRRPPDFSKNEGELLALWSRPDTRRKLLKGLAENAFAKEHLAENQKIIDAEKSDLFDALAHVANETFLLPFNFKKPRHTPKTRVDKKTLCQQVGNFS
jgi:type I restriction enzyme, R subunit